MMLAQMPRADLRSRRDRPHLRRMCITKKVGSAVPMLPIIPSGRIRPSQPRHPHRSNRHSARGTANVPPSRFPSLEAFGRQPPVLVATSVRGRHPKPLHNGRLCEYVGVTTGLPQLADDCPHSTSRQSRANRRHSPEPRRTSRAQSRLKPRSAPAHKTEMLSSTKLAIVFLATASPGWTEM